MTNKEILIAVAEGKLTAEEAATLLAPPATALRMKVSEKGGLSIYGLGKWPLTLYADQWSKLLDTADEIRRFLKENASTLKQKG